MYIAAALVAIVIGLSVSGFILYDGQGQPAKAGASPPVDKSGYYKSLDLGLARQATYTNKPITVVKDLGVLNNVRESVVSFGVPKDGLNEYGLMTLPLQKLPAGKKYPVIVLCHGYVTPQAYSTLNDYTTDMDFYSQHGFAVIKPDYRGNGLSLTDGTPDGAYYSMSYNTDVMSLIAAIKQTSFLDDKNISIWGHSMGGYIALRAAVISPDIKNVILLSAPVGTAEDMYGSYMPVSDANNPTALEIRNNELTAHGTPLSDPTYWNSASPLNYLKDTKAYIQIHVGSNDQIVPPQFSIDLSDKLTSLKKPHQYFVYAGADHGLVTQREAIWQRSLEVLNAKKH